MKNKKHKNKPLFKFFVIVFSIVGIFLITASVGVSAYMKANYPVRSLPEPDFQVGGENYEQKDKKNIIQDFLLPPQKTNFFIVGTDYGNNLTDTIIVGSFDRETKEINLISIPRDTYIKMPKEEVDSLREAGRQPPSNGVMKINAVNSYAGKDLGMVYLQRQLERLLQIKIHYNFVVNLEAFRSIVDEIGGVQMEIRKGGYYYKDPEQNLVISVPGGMQILDGKMAEGVVRYRHDYARGDVERVEVQQEFMKELFKQVLGKDDLVNTASALAANFIKYVDTNFGVGDIPKYVPYIKDLSGSDLITQTLPGEGTNESPSYFIHNEEEVAELVEKIFYSDEPTKTSETSETAIEDSDINSLKIQVLNGGITKGIAGTKFNELKQSGFDVIDFGDYTGTKKTETRIMVADETLGEPFKKFFKNSDIEIDTNLPEEYDVVIIIGLSE